MARTRVVILSGHSLFAEGVASRLSQYPEEIELKVLDPRSADCLEALRTQGPAAIILDATDVEVTELCPLYRLLEISSRLRIIHLDTQEEEIRIVSSSRQKLDEVRDLIQVIERH